MSWVLNLVWKDSRSIQVATKNISIDAEVYKRLRLARRPNESFSQTIKRLLRPPLDQKDWLKKVTKMPKMDRKMTKAIERQIRNRKAA